jgi:hypothetical protein
MQEARLYALWVLGPIAGGCTVQIAPGATRLHMDASRSDKGFWK